YPDTAARMFTYLWRYSYNLRGLYETPVLALESGAEQESIARATAVINAARAAGHLLLTEPQSKAILAAYGLPTVETRVAAIEDKAVRAAEEIGYPVVLKVYSETITHKTEVDGVRLNLPDAAAARRAYQEIRAAVTGRAGAERFQGVTVQPM